MAQDAHTAWTGTSGQAWGELQDVIDGLFREIGRAHV